MSDMMITIDMQTFEDMADRIEELEAACWRMKEDRDMVIGLLDSDKDRADAAEAKLAKAVEALRYYAQDDDDGGWLATETLAELKGETNE